MTEQIDMRAAFEREFGHLDLLSYGGKGYTSKVTNRVWHGWQVAWQVRASLYVEAKQPVGLSYACDGIPKIGKCPNGNFTCETVGCVKNARHKEQKRESIDLAALKRVREALDTFDQAMRNGSTGPEADRHKAKALKGAHRKASYALTELDAMIAAQEKV